MGERIETALPPMQPGAGWALNLTAQRRQNALRCRMLQATAPFLALGGRYLPQAIAARSSNLLASMPWLAPRWLEWPDSNKIPAHTKEPAMRLPQTSTSGMTSPPAHARPQQQAQPPIVFALALQLAYTGMGPPGRGRSNSPAQVSPFSEDLHALAPLAPVPAEPDEHLVRTKRETANVVMGSAFPQSHIQPQIPLLRLPKTGPARGPLGGFRELAPGTPTAASYRIMIPAVPGRRVRQAELLFQSSPEANDAPEVTLLSEHKLHGGPENAASGPMTIRGLSMVIETIRHTMKREVAAAIREREEKAQPLASNRSSGIDMTAAENFVSDNFVLLFMQKMRKLAEEERFRLGLLR